MSIKREEFHPFINDKFIIGKKIYDENILHLVSMTTLTQPC